MLTVDLSRAQFAATTVYHFFFVPVTIGLAFFVAIMQSIWHRSGDPQMRRLTHFFGTLLLINVAIGVVTGLVQEFEFGMNWSAYSRFVGDVFGGPSPWKAWPPSSSSRPSSGSGSSAGTGSRGATRVRLIALAVQLRGRRHLSLQSTAVAELLVTTGYQAISLTFEVANVECIYPEFGPKRDPMTSRPSISWAFSAPSPGVHTVWAERG